MAYNYKNANKCLKTGVKPIFLKNSPLGIKQSNFGLYGVFGKLIIFCMNSYLQPMI